ncbi:MAG: penicillin-binding protein 1A [Janthinobacterium sp.]
MDDKATILQKMQQCRRRLLAPVPGLSRAAWTCMRRGAGIAWVCLHAVGMRLWTYLIRQKPLRRVGLVLGALGALLLLYMLMLIPLTPSIKDLKQVRSAQPTLLLSSDGKVLASFDQGQHDRIKLDQVSPYVIDALVSTEDHRFYQHHGIDFTRTASAVLQTLGGDAQGGSTLTQQLARNMFPEDIGRSRNLNRKLKELITALKIESTYSKDEILEMYLNTVPFLYNAFGIEMAARTYFNKSAARLDILESATLVGMLKGTSYYNPVNNPERSVARRNVVLGQMRKHGHITEARYKTLSKRALRVHFNRQQGRVSSDTHFTAHVRKWLIDWADENDYNLDLDGLQVYTTLDSGLQALALRAVERESNALQNIADVEWSQSGAIASTSTGTYADMHNRITPFRYFWESRGDLVNAFIRETPEYRNALAGGEKAADALRRFKADGKFIARLRALKTRLEAGFVALDPGTGAVKAWVGSRNFEHEQFDHVVQAARQPGSTFKPIVYGAALEKGLLPDRPYLDQEIDIKASDGSIWRPTDMSGSSGKMMTLRDGLVYSKNTITAQVMQDTGLPAIVKLARAVGINHSKLNALPSLALGTSPVTLLEMVSAYATIADQGQYRKPVFVSRILDRHGKELATFETPGKQAMSGTSARQLIDMMRGVIDSGTGQAIRSRFGIRADVAGKTGTTQNNTDGWFILMHPNLVAGAWVGFNDARVTMRSNYWGQGGHNAALLVGDFFRNGIDGGNIDGVALFPGGTRAVRPVISPAPVDEQIEPSVPQETEPVPDQLRRNEAQLESEMSGVQRDQQPPPDQPPHQQQYQRQDDAAPSELRQELRP